MKLLALCALMLMPPDASEFGWKVESDRTIGLAFAGANTKAFSVSPDFPDTQGFAISPEKTNLRIEVHAEMPVAVRVVPLRVVKLTPATPLPGLPTIMAQHDRREDSYRIEVDDRRAPVCDDTSVLETTISCLLNVAGPYALAVVDERGDPNVAAAILGALARSTEQTNRAANPNRVRIVIWNWTCIKNCR